MARVGHVSWLEAACSPSRGFLPSGISEQPFPPAIRTNLLQWRGRAGLSPASVTTHPPYLLRNEVSRGTEKGNSPATA